MRNTLYFLTMFLNFLGILFCVGLIFILKSAFIIYLPLILLSFIIFTFSFAVTFFDFSNKISRTKNRYIIQKPQITDYREYFVRRRSEFMV